MNVLSHPTSPSLVARAYAHTFSAVLPPQPMLTHLLLWLVYEHDRWGRPIATTLGYGPHPFPPTLRQAIDTFLTDTTLDGLNELFRTSDRARLQFLLQRNVGYDRGWLCSDAGVITIGLHHESRFPYRASDANLRAMAFPGMEEIRSVAVALMGRMGALP